MTSIGRARAFVRNLALFWEGFIHISNRIVDQPTLPRNGFRGKVKIIKPLQALQNLRPPWLDDAKMTDFRIVNDTPDILIEKERGCFQTLIASLPVVACVKKFDTAL